MRLRSTPSSERSNRDATLVKKPIGLSKLTCWACARRGAPKTKTLANRSAIRLNFEGGVFARKATALNRQQFTTVIVTNPRRFVTVQFPLTVQDAFVPLIVSSFQTGALELSQPKSPRG